MPVDNSALLGIPDIKLLDILKIKCEVVGDQQADRKFNSQIYNHPVALPAKQTQACRSRQIMQI